MEIALATKHAKRRLQERYGRAAHDETVLEHLALILAGESFLESRNSAGRETHLIHDGRQQFAIVFCPTTKRIITYLPAGRAR